MLSLGHVQGMSEPECKEWTQTQCFDANPSLEPAEDAYIKMVAGVIEANCLNDNNELKSCDVRLGDSDIGSTFAHECTKTGGVMWQYDYSPKCGDTHVSQTAKPVLVCASSQCSTIGVQNLIPAPGMLDPLVEAGHTCGTGTMNLKEAPSSGSGTVMFSHLLLYGGSLVALMTF